MGASKKVCYASCGAQGASHPRSENVPMMLIWWPGLPEASGGSFGKLVADETVKWEKVVKTIGLSIE